MCCFIVSFLYLSKHISLVYTRILTRVQLTSGHEPSSNSTNGCGLSQPGLQSAELGPAFTLEGIRVESVLEFSCKELN